MSAWQTLRHRASRYINSWERNRPRFLRRRVLDFPPITSLPHPQQLVVLCEADKFTDGLWSAWSWLRFLRGHLRLHLFVDGIIKPERRRDFERLFPGAELSSVSEFLATHNTRPADFQTFLENHWFAPKLALLIELQQTTSFLYSDCDVLAFQTPQAIIDTIERGTPNAYNVDPAARHDRTNVDRWINERAAQLSLTGAPDFNSGLLWITQGSLDSGLFEQLLTGWTHAVDSHFAEQTILGVLFAASQATPLPEVDYLVSGQGMHFWEKDLDCRDLTVRHYVGNVRHRMYAHAYPYIAAQAFAQNGA